MVVVVDMVSFNENKVNDSILHVGRGKRTVEVTGSGVTVVEAVDVTAGPVTVTVEVRPTTVLVAHEYVVTVLKYGQR